MLSKLLLWLSAIFSFHLALGQYAINFKRLGVNEGLSQNSVREIFQDRQGFIWIGTGDGLNRYDGIQIKKYRQSLRDRSHKRFPGKILNGRIHQDDQGYLWMVVDGQLVKMDVATETFTVIRPIGTDLEFSVIGITGSEVYLSNLSGVTIVKLSDRSIKRIELPNVFGMHQYSNANPVFFYKKAASVYQFDIHTRTSKPLYQTSKDSIYCATFSWPSMLISTGTTIIDFNLQKEKVSATYTVPDTASYRHLTPMVKTKGGDIIAAIPSKGFVYIDSSGKSFSHYMNVENEPYSLSSNLIYTAIIDSTNNVWFGTEGGGISIFNLKPPLFKSFPDMAVVKKESSLMMVKSMFHQNGKIYVGTYARGLYIIDRHTSQYKTTFEPARKHDPAFAGIFLIKKDDKGRIWMNCGNRIGTADPDKGAFLLATNIDYIRKGKSHNILQCFAQIDSNKYIAGTVQSTYLIEEKQNRLTVLDLGEANDLLEGDIQTICKKDNGDIFIGKGEGKGLVLIRLSGLNHPEILKTDLMGRSVKYIHRDRFRQAYWFATNVGIVIQADNSNEKILMDEENGLSNDFIYSIIPEDDHCIWISTNKGINRITLKKNSFAAISGVEQYGIQHGLQSNEFNTGAYFKDGHLIFFGGVTGINWFDERNFINRKFLPRSYITELLINEKPLLTDSAINFLKKIPLKHNENSLLVRFATLDFTDPLVNQYLYRLAGYDNTWIQAGNKPEARYSNLPPGQYSFEIISCNSEGVWSSADTLLHLSISPPFWLTWWFRITVALAMTAILFFVIKYYYKRKMEKQLRLIEQQLAVNNERLRISRDMHDELGTGLSKIALLSEVGKNQHTIDSNHKIIHEINDTSRDLADKMGEIIWTLNPQNDTLGNLAAYLKEYIYETTDALPVTAIFEYPEIIPDVSLRHMVRQQLMLVTKEAVNNALKHSQATRLTFSLLVEDGTMLFSLRDNGVGFRLQPKAPFRNGKKNGLSNMKIRMEQIGGNFSCYSHPGRGTELRFGITI